MVEKYMLHRSLEKDLAFIFYFQHKTTPFQMFPWLYGEKKFSESGEKKPGSLRQRMFSPNCACW
jgi:hypothetical protein